MTVRLYLGVYLTLVLASTFLVACEKPVEPRTPIAVAEQYSDYPIAGFSNVDGVIGAIKDVNFVSTDSGVVQYKNRVVQAFFHNSDTLGTYMSAGKIYLDTISLTADSKGIYTYSDLTKYPNGYPFKDTVTWIVGGNIARFINPFSYNTLDMAGYTSQPIIDTTLFSLVRTAPFRLKMLNSLSNITAYSGVEVFTVYVIRQGSKTISRTLSGASQEYLFPIAELQGFSPGSATVEIAAYRAHKIDNIRKKFYVLNGCRSIRSIQIL